MNVVYPKWERIISKGNPKEKTRLKIVEVEKFFKKIINNHMDFSQDDEMYDLIKFYSEPRTEGINLASFAIALRELKDGKKDGALKILNNIIQQEAEHHNNSGVKFLSKLVKYIEEATNEDLFMIEAENYNTKN